MGEDDDGELRHHPIVRIGCAARTVPDDGGGGAARRARDEAVDGDSVASLLAGRGFATPALGLFSVDADVDVARDAGRAAPPRPELIPTL